MPREHPGAGACAPGPSGTDGDVEETVLQLHLDPAAQIATVMIFLIMAFAIITLFVGAFTSGRRHRRDG